MSVNFLAINLFKSNNKKSSYDAFADFLVNEKIYKKKDHELICLISFIRTYIFEYFFRETSARMCMLIEFVLILNE